jgi:hypothetical protein
MGLLIPEWGKSGIQASIAPVGAAIRLGPPKAFPFSFFLLLCTL